MRQSGRLLRSVVRCLSQDRPCPVITQPFITCLSIPSSVAVIPSLLTRHYTQLGALGRIDESQAVETSHTIRYREAVLSASHQRRGLLTVGDGDEELGISRHHEESLIIGYSPLQLYSVVAAVDLYEDFVPWCQKSTIVWSKPDEALEAELEIGFKFFIERYTSHVELKKPHLIKTSVSASNLFDYLTNSWEFKPGPHPHSTNLHFVVKFQFRSPLYRTVADMFFNEVAQKLVGSFENRCRNVYGPSLEGIGTHKMPVLSG